MTDATRDIDDEQASHIGNRLCAPPNDAVTIGTETFRVATDPSFRRALHEFLTRVCRLDDSVRVTRRDDGAATAQEEEYRLYQLLMCASVS